eukprot:jgi/Pico_ML_1/54739/g609.t1
MRSLLASACRLGEVVRCAAAVVETSPGGEDPPGRFFFLYPSFHICREERAMYTDFKEKAIEYVKQAVEEDNAGNYDEALKLYMYALEYFKTHLKYEKNPKAKEAITNKFKEYLERAETLRGVIDKKVHSPTNGSGNAGIGTKARPTAGSNDNGAHEEDAEVARLRARLQDIVIVSSSTSMLSPSR